MSFRVTFKKQYHGIDQKDEDEALGEAEHQFAQEFAYHGLECLGSEVEKEPVKEITITEDGIKQFLDNNFEGVELTEQQVKAFMDFLEIDVTEWLKENIRCFLKEE